MNQAALEQRKAIIKNLRLIANNESLALPVVVEQLAAQELLAMLEETRTVAETFETMFENGYYAVIDESVGGKFLASVGTLLDRLYEIFGDKP